MLQSYWSIMCACVNALLNSLLNALVAYIGCTSYIIFVISVHTSTTSVRFLLVISTTVSITS